MTTFRDLEAWRRAIALTELCYSRTTNFPKSELFGLVAQMRRATVSVASNIAEGHCRRSTGAYLNHVSIALGSHGELSTLIELSARLGFLNPQHRSEFEQANETVGRLLYGLYRAVSNRARLIHDPDLRPPTSDL